MLLNPENFEQALQLLGELLTARKTAHYDLVVCGGSALLATGLVSRSTHDVDVLARKNPDGEVFRAHPLPEELLQAAGEVARELGLESHWLNSSASFHFPDFDALPNSFWVDLDIHDFGDCLRVRFVTRSGQIILKLYAALNRAETRDIEDLLALNPDATETEAGLDWLLDSIPGLTHRNRVPELLTALGHDELTERFRR